MAQQAIVIYTSLHVRIYGLYHMITHHDIRRLIIIVEKNPLSNILIYKVILNMYQNIGFLMARS